MSFPLTVTRKHDPDKYHLRNLKYQYFNCSSNLRVNIAHDKMHSLKGFHYSSLDQSFSWWTQHIGLTISRIHCGHRTIFLQCSQLLFWMSNTQGQLQSLHWWSCRRKNLLWSQSHIFTGGVIFFSNLVLVKSTLWFNFVIIFFSLAVS